MAAARSTSWSGCGEIRGVLIRLDVDGAKTVFITLDATGNIRRLGSAGGAVLSGMSSPELFEQLRRRIGPALLQWKGQSWQDPAPRGKRCELTIGLREPDGSEALIRWSYGSESHEPPPEILDFVIAAIEATEPWHRRLTEARRSRSRRPEAPGGWRLVSLWPT